MAFLDEAESVRPSVRRRIAEGGIEGSESLIDAVTHWRVLVVGSSFPFRHSSAGWATFPTSRTTRPTGFALAGS